MDSTSLRRVPGTPPVSVEGAKSDRPASIEEQASALFSTIQNCTDAEKFTLLKTLWVASKSGNVSGKIRQLAEDAQFPAASKPPGSDPAQLRIALTQRILASSPVMEALAGQFDQLLESAAAQSGDHALLSRLIGVHVRAYETTRAARGNLLFSFLHLISLKVKAPVIENIGQALARHATASDAARQAMGKLSMKAAHRQSPEEVAAAHAAAERSRTIDKALVRSAARDQMTAHIRKRMDHLLRAKVDPDRSQSSLLCEKALDAMPAEVRSLAAWGKVKQRMEKYIHHTADIEGEPFRALLQASMHSLPSLMDSFKIYSKLPDDLQDKMAFERQLWNIQNNTSNGLSTPASANREVVGVGTSFANKVAAGKQGMRHPVLQPGNQLAIAMRTPLMTVSEEIREVVVLSCVAPALDSEAQPDFGVYVRTWTDAAGEPQQELNQSAFLDAFTTVADQVLQCAKENTQCKRVVLPALGLNAFLNGLQAGQRDIAQEIGSSVLAKLATDLQAAGKEVVFTDAQSPSSFLTALNQHLGDFPLSLAGAIPGDWIRDNDLIINAWDPHSLIGNKLVKDNSIDGFIGRNSLLHFMHGLHCAAHAEGLTHRAAADDS